jgi:cytochrome c556
MNKKLLSAAFAFAVGAVCSLPAYAQVKPDVLVKQRQSAMTLQGKYFGPMAGMQQGKVPYNAATVSRNAAYLEVLAKMPWDGFAESTKGEKTGALPSVFSEPAKFKQVSERFEAEATKLAQVSKGGDEAAVKNQIQAVAKACAACHDDFREKR